MYFGRLRMQRERCHAFPLITAFRADVPRPTAPNSILQAGLVCWYRSVESRSGRRAIGDESIPVGHFTGQGAWFLIEEASRRRVDLALTALLHHCTGNRISPAAGLHSIAVAYKRPGPDQIKERWLLILIRRRSAAGQRRPRRKRSRLAKRRSSGDQKLPQRRT
jgi:hypothetical protein